MKQRIITGVILFGILLPCLIFSNTPVFIVLITALSLVGAYEILNCVGLKKNPAVYIPVYIVALILPPTTRLFADSSNFVGFAFSLFFILLFYLLSLSVITKGILDITSMATVYTVTVYVVVGLSSIILTRDFQNGVYAYLLIFIGAWMTDIGAYFIGVLFGKHKLIPEVSPKKTVEGVIGGIATCVISFCVYGAIVGHNFDTVPNYISLIITALVISVISIFGDLIASIIKRHYNIKDYGKIFPGHGGVIDRFDSVIAVAPFFVILNSVSPFFNLFM